MKNTYIGLHPHAFYSENTLSCWLRAWPYLSNYFCKAGHLKNPRWSLLHRGPGCWGHRGHRQRRVRGQGCPGPAHPSCPRTEQQASSNPDRSALSLLLILYVYILLGDALRLRFVHLFSVSVHG